MKIIVDHGPDKKWFVISLQGDLSISTASIFDQHWEKIMNQNPKALGVLCKDIKFVDSTGIGSCVRLLKKAATRKVDFSLLDISEAIDQILITTNLKSFFPIQPSSVFFQKYSIKL